MLRTSLRAVFVVVVPAVQHYLTFLWLDENRWEGKDYQVELQGRADNRLGRAAHAESASQIA
jgi:hypothetical protein